DSRHPDLVTLKNYKRNVLRTPANNKLRLDDTRGREHIKLSTEHSGKSQLNLGHLVDGQRQKRGEGFELRTDGRGALRSGKGMFISADEQPRAQGQVLAMGEAMARLHEAGEQMGALSGDAQSAKADPADVQAQLDLLRQDLEQIKSAVLLLSAPKGIALSSGHHLQLAAERNLIANAGKDAALSVVRRLFIGVGEGISLFVRKLGLKLIANQGAVQIQAQNDRLELLARQGLDIVSTEDEIHITAKKKIVLNAGGSYISLDACAIESGTQGDHLIKAAHFDYQGAASRPLAMPLPPQRMAPPTSPTHSRPFNILLQDVPGEEGWALASTPWAIHRGNAAEPLMQGESDAQGKVLLDDEQQRQLIELYRSSDLWLSYPGQRVRLRLHTEHDDWDSEAHALAALDYQAQQPAAQSRHPLEDLRAQLDCQPTGSLYGFLQGKE
ncbi:uncharacterized protein (DUF2345 family), partial [Pseudomonas alcaligenes]|nr:uncharacterized protein (DUF2345 family) [Pseudomonas alcaligenes]